ncbi:VapE domain-containing protein [Brevundimonas sp. SL161]|uniref:VapE domain-containing protein n=1 Tax=Brevundimonas sp. SL161 TaxID=2804613 RepID=UPI003CF29FBD
MARTATQGRCSAAAERPRTPSEQDVLSAVEPLVDAGIAVHWLHRREKRPIGEHWQTAPVHTLESLAASYQRGLNVGVRLGELSNTPFGYLHLIDMDIRDPDQAGDAWAVMLKMWPEARDAAYVISGSGGESRHLYFFTDKPFRSAKLAKSAGHAMVFDPKKGRDVRKNDWEIELFGSPKQAVLPPSVHPDTGENYRWGRELNFDLLGLGIGAILPSDLVETWGAAEDNLSLGDDDDDGLWAAVRSSPMGLSEADIESTLRDLPEDFVDDYDNWVMVGMALHHEYEGSQVGFERWCEWARQSAKFDVKESKYRWTKAFKGTSTPVRMATLIQAAGRARLEREMGELDDLMSDEDESPAPRPAGTALALVDDFDSMFDADVNAEFEVETADSIDLDDLLAPIPAITPGATGVTGLGPVDPEWKSYLQMNEDGVGIKATLHNLELIIKHDPRTRGVMATNEFTQELVQIARPKAFRLKKAGPKPVRQLSGPEWVLGDAINGDLWTSSQDGSIRIVLEAPTRQGGYGLRTSKRDLDDALNACASQNRFHPIRTYLEGLTWDRTQRVANLFVDYVGAPDTAYHREAALLFMLGAVTRVFEPGHKFDFVPILEGLQGKRKSTFIRILAKHWFCELEGDFHDTKAMVEKMQGAWILEIAELQGFSKSEVTTIKGFISRTFDKVRLAFEHRAKQFPRQCVFIGSTNDVEYLKDHTGGRRFWPIECGVDEINTDRLHQNVDQLWAEALTIYREWRSNQPVGDLPLFLKNEAAAREARELQESRRQETAEEQLAGQLGRWLDSPINDDLGYDHLDDAAVRSRVCSVEIWREMMHNDGTPDQRKSVEIGRALRLLGWRPMKDPRKTKKYGNQRVYERAA